MASRLIHLKATQRGVSNLLRVEFNKHSESCFICTLGYVRTLSSKSSQLYKKPQKISILMGKSKTPPPHQESVPFKDLHFDISSTPNEATPSLYSNVKRHRTEPGLVVPLPDLEAAVSSMVQELLSLDNNAREAPKSNNDIDGHRIVASGVVLQEAENLLGKQDGQLTSRQLLEMIPALPYFMVWSGTDLNKQLWTILHSHDKDHVRAVCQTLLLSQAGPTVVTYNILIRGFSLLRLNEAADIVVNGLLRTGFEFSAYTYTALLNLYTSTNDYPNYLLVYKQLYEHRNRRHFRNPWINTCTVVGWSKFRRFGRAKHHLKYMKDRNLFVSKEALTIQMKLAALHAHWSIGSRIMYYIMDRRAHEVDARMWFWAMKLCKNCRKQDDVAWLNNLAKTKNIPLAVFDRPPPRTKSLYHINLKETRSSAQTSGDQKNSAIVDLSGSDPRFKNVFPDVFQTDPAHSFHTPADARVKEGSGEAFSASLLPADNPLWCKILRDRAKYIKPKP